jgi:hypothetical protein
MVGSGLRCEFYTMWEYGSPDNRLLALQYDLLTDDTLISCPPLFVKQKSYRSGIES